MKWKSLDLYTCLNLISSIILLVGLGSSMLIYRAAENNVSGVIGYDEEGGSVYPIMPGETKKYLRDMELYGGKANVIADEFRRWVAGLWHGKSLAYTVACVAIVTSFGIFYYASRLPSRQDPDVPNKNNIEGTNKES